MKETVPAKPAERILAWTAVSCWLAAWFLPVMEGVRGWDAFRMAIAGPFRGQFATRGEVAVTEVVSALTNLVFVLLFVQWLRGQTRRPLLFLKIALICLILDLYWLVEMLRTGERHGLLAGYYVWLAAFGLLVAVGAVSAVSARRTSKTPTAGTPA